jgi:CheY-like chemotaxis protein
MIEPRVLDLKPQLGEMERLLKRLLGERIALAMELPANLWRVKVDPLALEQIVVNLVVNARDAMPNGGVFTITGSNVTIGGAGHLALGIAAGEWVRLDLRDTGVGIDENIRAQIFEPFFTTKGDAGTGLGLATVHGTVTQAGGHVRVESTLGQGTTFSIFLPRVAATVPSTGTATSAAPLARSRGDETVLLIEDEASVRDVTAKLLGKLGYDVLVAVDGRDGVARAAAHRGPIHLIVSDLMMPQLGGVEAVELIHSTRPKVPVLFISGYSEQAVQWHDRMAAKGRFLSKPFAVDELATAIRQSLDA